MTLTAIGKISMPNLMCEKCGCAIQSYNYSESLKCSSCGAIYETSGAEIKDGAVEIVYEFLAFQCLHATYNNPCKNVCPAPEMYCKEHTSDSAFDDANKNIKYYEDLMTAAQDKLHKMEESKKTWLITEVSGLNEDDPVSKD